MTRIPPTASPTPAQARTTYENKRYMRATLAMPVPSFSTPLLPDIPGDEVNMLPRPHGVPLPVQVPLFDITGTAGDIVRIQLRWNGQNVGTAVNRTFPLNPADFPLTLTLPASSTSTHGRYELGYRATIFGNGGNSDTLSVFVDNVAPNLGVKGAEVILPPEVADGITREYLDANSNEVEITIPTYQEIKLEDKVEVFVGKKFPGALLDTLTISSVTDPIVATLPEAHFNGEEGQYLIYYNLSDRTGNTGPDSSIKIVDVVLTLAPDNLKPPLVPQADDAEGIDLNDAIAGVGVEIEAYDNALSKDLIQVYWDGKAVPGRLPVTPGGFPLFATVPYIMVRDTPPSPGPKTSKVTYEVIRDGRVFPEAVGLEVDVDLTVAGPPDPGTDPDPGLGNPALALVTVQAANTTDPNKLEPVDNGEDATATVPLYAGAAAGEIMHLLWAGEEVATYDVTGNEAPGADVTFTIPWADIEAKGNSAALPVRYEISNADNLNRNRSPIREVSVNVLTTTLPAVSFLHWYSEDPSDPLEPKVLNCSSLRQVGGVWGLEVRVQGGEPNLEGKTLTFTYQGWEDDAGSTPKPGTEEKNVTKIPTADEAANGFSVLVPYTPAVLNTLDRWGSVTYQVVIDGFPITATRDLLRVYMAVPGGGTCPLSFGVAAKRRLAAKGR